MNMSRADDPHYKTIGGIEEYRVLARRVRYGQNWDVILEKENGYRYWFDLYTSRVSMIRDTAERNTASVVRDLGHDRTFRVLLMVKLFAPHLWNEKKLPNVLKMIYEKGMANAET